MTRRITSAPRSHRLLSAFVILTLFLVACGGDGDDAPRTPDNGDGGPARTEAQDRREIETLVRSFFEALITGDDTTLWGLISSDIQSQVERDGVAESVALVAQVYEDPGFQFNGFIFFDSDGQRATFQIDAYTTNRGQRVGTEAQAAASPPLNAVYEDGRWRLEPEISLLRLNETQINVDG